MVQYKRALPVGFAIVLAISCIVAWFVGYQRELERQRHEVNTAAAITIEACLPSIETLRFGEFTQCLVEVFQADPDALREKFDLKAQQDMALWAFGMLLVSMVGVIITAVGTIYIAATLKQTRSATSAANDSVEEARKATITAQEAVAVAREMGQYQVASYLGIERCSLEYLGDDSFKLQIIVQNTGQTPARDITVTVRVAVTLSEGNIAGGLVSRDRQLYPNRYMFSFLASSNQAAIYREMVAIEDFSFNSDSKSNILANFTFMIEINYRPIFGGIFEERHVWHSVPSAVVAQGALIEAVPVSVVPDIEEYFPIYQPSSEPAGT